MSERVTFVSRGWTIVHWRGFMHTNWALGRGVESWPGQMPVLLFDTRDKARAELKRIRAVIATRKEHHHRLPFNPSIVRVMVTAKVTR